MKKFRNNNICNTKSVISKKKKKKLNRVTVSFHRLMMAYGDFRNCHSLNNILSSELFVVFKKKTEYNYWKGDERIF